MFNLKPKPRPLTEIEKREQRVARYETVDELLAACCEHGCVNLFQHSSDGSTWSANCEMPTGKKNTQACARSGFGHQRPHDALRALLEELES